MGAVQLWLAIALHRILRTRQESSSVVSMKELGGISRVRNRIQVGRLPEPLDALVVPSDGCSVDLMIDRPSMLKLFLLLISRIPTWAFLILVLGALFLFGTFVGSTGTPALGNSPPWTTGLALALGFLLLIALLRGRGSSR